MNSPRTATDTGYSPLLLMTVRDVRVIMLTMSILSKVSSHHTRLPSTNENNSNQIVTGTSKYSIVFVFNGLGGVFFFHFSNFIF